ncbi:CLUMA_CG008477, isoform A [Clunio marinus]|uniref:CLUMA_CG008477, isoform A n=1 Tax=Clunio marinus TaxID=568069 RepID=A0A1J1I7Q3_9DIPT|nr:CLUMA_CG008477, isoform A [Clunio marinus]
MAFKFVAFVATLALANAGIISEPASYSSLSYAAPVKTLVQPVSYQAPVASSSQYQKTVSYSQPKAYVAQPAVASYQSYEPVAVSSYHHQPQQVYAAQPAYGHYDSSSSSQQNILRSSHGTVSHISKTIDTPVSSIRKYDTRVINDGYKTVSYAQPAAYVAQPATYVSHQPAAYVSHQPAAYASYQPEVHSYTQVAQPLLTKTIAQPVVAKTIVSQPIAHVAQPTHYAAQPSHYAAHAPVLASKVHYSPAIEVAHASYESPVAHYSW